MYFLSLNNHLTANGYGYGNATVVVNQNVFFSVSKQNAELSRYRHKLEVVVALDLNGLVQFVKFPDLDGVPDRNEERAQVKKVVNH